MNQSQRTRYAGLNWLMDRLQTRSRRRSTATFYLGVLASIAVASWLVDSYWVLAPFFVLFMAATVVLHGSVRGMAEASKADLDERQLALRNAGYRYTYWAGVMTAFLGGLFIQRVGDWDTAFEAGLFVTVWGLISGLPALFLAWTLPNEEPDEDK